MTTLRTITGSVDPRIPTLLAAAGRQEGKTKGYTSGQAMEWVNQMIAVGGFIVEEHEEYFRKEITSASGNWDFKVAQQDFDEAITSFKNGSLQEGTHNLVTGIRLGVARSGSAFGTGILLTNAEYGINVYNATDVAADDTDLNSGETGNQFAPVNIRRISNSLMNAQFVFDVAGVERLNLFGHNFFLPNSVGKEIGGVDGVLDLKSAVYIHGDSGNKVNFRLNFTSSGATALDNYTAMEVVLKTLRLKFTPGAQM